jgi:hypothetical protein
MAPSSSGSQQPRSLREMQEEFQKKYFPDGGSVPQAAITLHDAAHTYTGYSTGSGFPAHASGPSYGEAMQGIADSAGTRELWRRTRSTSPVIGTVNSPYGYGNTFDGPQPITPRDWEVSKRENDKIHAFNKRVLRPTSSERGVHGLYGLDNVILTGRGNLKSPPISSDAPLEEINSPNRKYTPPITPEDTANARKMGEDFYRQVANEFNRDPQRPGMGDYPRAAREIPIDVGDGEKMFAVSEGADYLHHNPDRIFITGGAKPGALTAGHIMQHVSPPLHPGVNESVYRELALREMRKKNRQRLAIKGGGTAIDPPQGYGQIKLPSGETIKLMDLDRLMKEGGIPGDSDWLIDSLRLYDNDDLPAVVAVDNAESEAVRRGMKNPEAREFIESQSVKNFFNEEGRQWVRRAPPGREVSVLKMPSTPEAAETIVTAREIGRVAKAARTGARAVAGVAGNVPWLDPTFRNAVERNDMATAAKAVATDYAVGAAVSPVAAAGAGVLQRTAPRMAGQILPVLGGVGTAASRLNPILATTMLSGDTPVRGGAADPRRAVYDERAVRDQSIRAETARRRGGRWRVGPFTVPELGISESGGLFFGGPQPRQRATAPTPAPRPANRPVRGTVPPPKPGPNIGNEAMYIWNQLGRGKLPYSR